MAKVNRKMKEEKVSVSYWDFEGKIGDILAMFEDWVEKYGKDARLDWDWYYDEINVELTYQRKETEQEAQKRIEAARKARERRKAKKVKDDAAKEARELKELARLKKKYEESDSS